MAEEMIEYEDSRNKLKENEPPEGVKVVTSRVGQNIHFPVDDDDMYLNYSVYTYALYVVTAVVLIVYAMVAIFKLPVLTTPALILNGTLVQVELSPGVISFVQLSQGSATLLDMSTITPSPYNGTELSKYLPAGMAYTCTEELGGFSDYFAVVYSTLYVNSFTAFGKFFGYGGVASLYVPGPLSQYISTSLNPAVLAFVIFFAFFIPMVLTCTKLMTSDRIELCNRILLYITSLCTQLAGLLTVFEILDNSRMELIPLVVGVAIMIESVRWYQSITTWRLEERLNSREFPEPGMGKADCMSLKRNVASDAVMDVTLYALFMFALGIVLGLRSQNWGFYGRMAAWGDQYGDMISEISKGTIWTYIGICCILFPIMHLILTLFQVGKVQALIDRNIAELVEESKEPAGITGNPMGLENFSLGLGPLAIDCLLGLLCCLGPLDAPWFTKAIRNTTYVFLFLTVISFFAVGIMPPIEAHSLPTSVTC